MLKFQRDALRRGDTVFVHDASDADLGLAPGSSHSSTSARPATTSAFASPPEPRPGPSFDPDGSPCTSRPWMTTTAGVAATTGPGHSQPLVESQRNVQPSPESTKGFIMVKVGDRIRLSSTKGPDRDGVVTAVTGSLLRVRWPSHEETTVAPAPGTLTVLAATETVNETTPTRKAARKKSATATKTTAGKKATPDNTRSPTRGGQTTIALINAPQGMRLALA